MKLFVVLACFLATAWCRVPEPYQRSPIGQEWHYQYEGQAMTGIPTLLEKYSGLGIKSIIVIRKVGNEEFEMFMRDPRFANVNQQFHEGSFSKKMKPLVYTRDESLEQHLKKPVKFYRIDGHVQRIRVQANDPFWSVNVKKGCLSLLNVNLRTVRESQTNPSTYRPAKTVREVTVQGVCPTLYQLFPQGQGPKTLLQLKKTMQNTENLQQNTREMIQVVKTVQLDQCDKRPVIITTTPTVEYCKDCRSRAQSKIAESAETRYVFSASGLTIVDVESEGETLIPKLGQHPAVVSTTQKMTLLRSRKVEDPENQPTNYDTFEHPLTFSAPTTPMEIMAYFAPVSASSLNVHPRVTSDAYQRDYLAPNHGDTAQSIILTSTERVQAIQKVKQAIHDLARDIINPIHKINLAQKPTGEVSIRMLAGYASYLTQTEFQDIYREYSVSGSEPEPEEQQIKRKLFLDMASMAGTAASVKFLKQLIENQTLKSFEAVDVLSGLQENIILPNVNFVNELVNLCHNSQVKKNHFMHSTVCISAAQVLRKACLAPMRIATTPRPLLPNICRPNLLNSTIDRLAQPLQSATEQEKAVYLQALGHSGTRRALQKMKPYVQKKTLPQILRTSAITALRHIAYYHPKQVLELVLPIYNNRQEHEVVRIAASSIMFASQPSYPILEKIAVDLAHETDNQVGSFVYTTLHTLANSTAPCLEAFAANVSKIVKLARPFKLDRTTAYRKIFALKDLSDHVNILADNEFLTSKTSGLPKYVSARLSTSTPGNLLNQIFEARMFHNGIEKTILEKFMNSRTDYDELPSSMRSILEKVKSMPRTPERKEGEVLLRLFERTLFAYINQENTESFRQKWTNTVRSIEQRLRSNYTGTYVKIMLPLKSSIIVPTQFGFPATFFHTTEVVFALRLKNVKLEIEPQNYLTERTSRLSKVVFHGKITPFLRHDSADIIGVINSANLKLYSTGHYVRNIVNLPVQMKLNYDGYVKNLTQVIQPQIHRMFVLHDSAPFTAITLITTMKPVYEAQGATKLKTNERPIQIDRQFGEDTFGVGLRIKSKSENPWNLHTLVNLKQMKQPVQQLPAVLMKLLVNPWLSHRQVLVRTEQRQRQARPFEVFVSVKHTLEMSTDPQQELRRGQETKREHKVDMKMYLLGTERTRWVTGYVEYTPTLRVKDLRAVFERSMFHRNDMTQKKLCIKGTVEDRPGIEYDDESLYNQESSRFTSQERREHLKQIRNLTVQYGRNCHERRITIKGELKEIVEPIENLRQPRRALATELKRRCLRERELQMNQKYRTMQLEQTVEHVQQSRVCRLAISDKATTRVAKYEIKRHNVQDQDRLRMNKVMQYVEYLFFPYRELNQSQSEKYQQERMPNNQYNVTVDTLQGIPVTTFTVLDQNQTRRFKDVHQQSKFLNKLVSLPTKSHFLQAFPLHYLVPARGICRISGSSIRTFDQVQYNHMLNDKCEYIVAQDLTPEQKFIVTVTKQSQQQQSKLVKVLVGRRLIEVQPTTSSLFKTVKVDGETIRLSPEASEHHTFITNSRESALIVKARYHKSLSDPIVEIHAPRLGLKVEVDNMVLVKVPKSRRGQVGGLCGDNNGEQQDEFRGIDECEYESVEEFVKSYRVPSAQCPEVQRPRYCQRQSQQEQQQGQNVEYRNKYEQRESTTCFSTLPQPKCRSGYQMEESQQVDVSYHCIQSATSLTRKFIDIIDSEDYQQRDDKEELNMLINKKVDFNRQETLPASCKPAY